MQASLELGNEIEHASKWPSVLLWSEMNNHQRSRSMRSFAIVKSTFSSHPRTSALIGAFSEGISLTSSAVDMNPNQASNGYELIRQLTLEYSVWSRSKALTFKLTPSETSPSSVVTDTSRRLDFESVRYQKLISTLPSSVDVVGLQLAEPDLVSIPPKFARECERLGYPSLRGRQLSCIPCCSSKVGKATEDVCGHEC